MKIVANTELCYGCKMCEILCSYHKQGIFSPEGGAIRVYKDHQSGKIHWTADTTCDNCEGEEQPLCIKYCPYGALIVGER